MKLLFENWKKFLIQEIFCIPTHISYSEMKYTWDKYTKTEEPGIPVKAIHEAKKAGIEII
tara:strand:+ start:389 stop:568 length:180 start_codon:yes stop_codon:yes gene_type:complete